MEGEMLVPVDGSAFAETVLPAVVEQLGAAIRRRVSVLTPATPPVAAAACEDQP